MDRYLAAAKAICDNYDLHGYREPDFDPVQDIAETIAGFDAEHDQTPASVEWLKTLGLEYFGEAAAWGFTAGNVHVGGLYLREPETFMNIGKQSLGRTPTRGDVLTALRLFGKKEGAT